MTRQRQQTNNEINNNQNRMSLSLVEGRKNVIRMSTTMMRETFAKSLAQRAHLEDSRGRQPCSFLQSPGGISPSVNLCSQSVVVTKRGAAEFEMTDWRGVLFLHPFRNCSQLVGMAIRSNNWGLHDLLNAHSRTIMAMTLRVRWMDPILG